MKLSKNVEILDGLPVIRIRSLSAIVCTDLHLGYEGVMADNGTFLPKVNLKKIKDTLKIAEEITGAKRIIVDGDIKNEFSKVHVEEFNEFREFVEYLKGDLGVKEITLIKGNHDNFIDRLKEPLKITVHRQETLIDDFLFFHGEEAPMSKGGELLIMGHVHPAISVPNGIGKFEKLKCFLYGDLKDGRKQLVLPAMNYFADGVSVNFEDISKMAPVFRKLADADKMRAFCIGEGETLDFGVIGDLRNL